MDHNNISISKQQANNQNEDPFNEAVLHVFMFMVLSMSTNSVRLLCGELSSEHLSIKEKHHPCISLHFTLHQLETHFNFCKPMIRLNSNRCCREYEMNIQHTPTTHHIHVCTYMRMKTLQVQPKNMKYPDQLEESVSFFTFLHCL